MEASKGFVQITAEEYDKLMDSQRALKTLLESDKCLEVSRLYSYDTGGPIYILNPCNDFRDLVQRLTEEKDISVKSFIEWNTRGDSKKIKLRHLGKTIRQVINEK